MNYKQIKEYFENYQRYILSSNDYTISSVLIPLVEIDDELHIVFQVRSSTLTPSQTRYHSQAEKWKSEKLLLIQS